jgi:hypothetical protein
MMQLTHDDHQERRQALYRFLLSRGNKWTSMEQATDSVNLYPAFFTTTYHNSHARRLLTSDIEAINSSDDFEKIIISNTNGIKLATEEELSSFLVSEYGEIFKKLYRVRKMAKKASRNLQLDLDGKARQAFLGGD